MIKKLLAVLCVPGRFCARSSGTQWLLITSLSEHSSEAVLLWKIVLLVIENPLPCG